MAGGTTEYIRNCLKEILQAVYGRDVRRAIHDAIEWTIDNMESAPIRMDELEAAIEELESNIESLHYLNNKTGVVVISGADLKMNKGVSGSKTVATCLSQSAGNVVVGKIAGPDDDYLLDITIGGLT